MLRGRASARIGLAMALARRIAVELERTIYVIAGLPIAVRVSRGRCGDLRRAFAKRYWRPQNWLERAELIVGIVLAPMVVPLAAIWFTAKNGPLIRKREGRSWFGQFGEQLRLYFSAGILAPWYYIFSLHRDGERRARTFLQRCETKWGLFLLLRPRNGSPLSDKMAFADRCSAAGVKCVPYWRDETLPDGDLFVKPARGRGGKGAERWDWTGPKHWSDGQQTLNEEQLIARLRGSREPMIVQLRLEPHPALARLTSGALPTVRALTCLNEAGDPELVAAVFRMSFGTNRTVDNIHAGGLACGVTLDEGVLGRASNLGSDAKIGWHAAHPTTGAPIAGMRLPLWPELKALAVQAHRAFDDRVYVGWDIAITEDGPVVVEGNGSPDMDLMQRFMETGFCYEHRFGELLAHHLRQRGLV